MEINDYEIWTRFGQFKIFFFLVTQFNFMENKNIPHNKTVRGVTIENNETSTLQIFINNV